MKVAAKGPLKIGLPFDEAIRRALRVKPPPEGWVEYEQKLRRKSRKTNDAGKRKKV